MNKSCAFYISGRGGLTVSYHQLFGTNSVRRLTGFPTLYHSPRPHPFGHTPWFVCLTATGLLRYSATFLLVRSYPTSMCCIKNQLWGKPFPMNPKLSYQSCHRSAKKALTGQLNSVRLANRLGFLPKECRSNH